MNTQKVQNSDPLDLAVVIVNYNVEKLLRRCLQSVFCSVGDFRMEVCVVDNNSPDSSVEMVKREFPQARLIANSDNPGYSAANNQGLRLLGVFDKIPPRYSLLLNPDTEVMPTTFVDAIAYMDAEPKVGVLGPKLLLPNGELDLACRRSFPTPEVSFYRMLGLSKLFPNTERFGRYNLTYKDIDELIEVDSVVGAFMLVRTSAIQQAGLLDEQFWMYGEDIDWAKRIKDNGWLVIYNPNIVTLHVKRASSRQSKKAQIEFYRAMLIFYYKHYQASTPTWLHWLIMAGIGFKGGSPIWPDIQAGSKILTTS
ncbi:MAG: glycosyltransferase family 2 protein [Candidatus Promineifilaceae bacterium]